MLRRIYRQRRRLGLGMALFVIVGLVVVPVRDAGGLLLAMLILPAGLTAVFALTVALRPGWGVIVELLAATTLLFELLFRSSPELERALAEAALPVRLALFLFTYYLLLQLGQSLNRLRWPGVLALEARRVIARPPAALWETLGRAGEADLSAGAERVLAATPGRFRHVLRQAPDPERPELPATADERLTLADHPRGTAVALARRWRNLPLLTALGHWLEDRAGDALDDLAAVAEGRPNWSATARRRGPGEASDQPRVTKPTAS